MSSSFYKFFIKILNFYFSFLLCILIMKDEIIKDFLENLNFSEKSKLKERLSHNITCYSDFAKVFLPNYSIPTESDEEETVDDITQVKNILEDEFHTYKGNSVFVESSHTDTKAITGEDTYIILSALLDFDIPREKKYSFCNDEVQKIYNKFFMDYKLFDKDINVEEYADFIEECDPIVFTVMLNCNKATMLAGVDLGNKLGSVIVKEVQLDETIDEKGLRKAVQDMIKCF